MRIKANLCFCKTDPEADTKAAILEPRNIRLRLRSASIQKSQPASRAASEIPPSNAKGSLSKHLMTLRPSSVLVSDPLLGSSRAPIVIPAAPALSQAKGKAPEVSAAPTDPVAEVSPAQATGQRKFKLSECFRPRSPMAPQFTEGLPIAYVPGWRITPSTIFDIPEVARDFMAHALPPSHRFMNFALNLEFFYDQYNMSICEGFFREAGMLQRVNALRDVNEGMMSELKTS
ncbi:hypothetical protein Hanom_Chr14g01252451 [Helianthus anomalus]